jgi:hypothetical protein
MEIICEAHPWRKSNDLVAPLNIEPSQHWRRSSMKKWLFIVTVALAFLYLCPDLSAESAGSQDVEKEGTVVWTESFETDECNFASTGKNTYFILEPGYELVLEGVEGEDTARVIITVLDETKVVGDVETRVVEEKEIVNGQVVEISRNFYAICTRTNSVFYFGEEVDIYEGGKVVSHGGKWRADSEGSSPGLVMPGTILLGARYYQEMAPGTAMDRAEMLGNTEIVETPAGSFDDCLKVEETTPLEPDDRDYKYYAPGIGLIMDEDLRLTRYGFRRK